jgi:hypothetical protein
MIKKRYKKIRISPANERAPLASNVGAVLLDLHSALRKAERCRILLIQLGYSEKRWQEIVRDVNPELRFMVRPQVLDAIITYLRTVGQPVNRKTLAQILHSQRTASLMRIKQTITVHLRNGNLKLFEENKIGLPDWKHKEKRQ